MKTRTFGRRLAAFLSCSALSIPSASGEPASPIIGEPAPPLNLEKLLQSPEGAAADWKSLEGNVVVLEFWSTWCGPCVAALPFLNKIEEKYEDKPVRFIAVTDEPESVVSRFLEKQAIRGWIGLDTDRSAFEAYNITLLPTTVLVDREGKLVGWTHPSAIVEEPEILDDLIAGKPRPLGSRKRLDSNAYAVVEATEPGIKGLLGAEGEPPLCAIVIRPARSMNLGFTANTSRSFLLQSVSLRTAIGRIHDVPDPYIMGSVPLGDSQKYDILFSWPKADLRRGQALLQQALAATFDLDIRRERRTTDVYVLTVRDGAAAGWEERMPTAVGDPEANLWAYTEEILERMQAGETVFQALGGTDELAETLSQILKRPVVDEAHIEGSYLFWFPHDCKKPDVEAAVRTMREKYNVVLASDRRAVEVLVVDPVSKSRSE